MLITNQYSSQPTSHVIGQTKVGSYQQQSAMSATTHSSDKVDFSSNVEQLQQKEREIASRYDVTNMSEKEMVAMANELHANGLITDMEHVHMSFERSKVFAMHFGVEDKSHVKQDFLANAKQDLEFAIGQGEVQSGIKSRQEVIAVLERMKSLARG